MASSSVLIVCLKNFTHHTKYLKIFYFKTKKKAYNHMVLFFFHLNNVKVRGGRISISYIIIDFSFSFFFLNFFYRKHIVIDLNNEIYGQIDLPSMWDKRISYDIGTLEGRSKFMGVSWVDLDCYLWKELKNYYILYKYSRVILSQ